MVLQRADNLISTDNEMGQGPIADDQVNKPLMLYMHTLVYLIHESRTLPYNPSICHVVAQLKRESLIVILRIIVIPIPTSIFTILKTSHTNP